MNLVRKSQVIYEMENELEATLMLEYLQNCCPGDLPLRTLTKKGKVVTINFVEELFQWEFPNVPT